MNKDLNEDKPLHSKYTVGIFWEVKASKYYYLLPLKGFLLIITAAHYFEFDTTALVISAALQHSYQCLSE